LWFPVTGQPNFAFAAANFPRRGDKVQRSAKADWTLINGGVDD
jgi:hypothetical protein